VLEAAARAVFHLPEADEEHDDENDFGEQRPEDVVLVHGGWRGGYQQRRRMG